MSAQNLFEIFAMTPFPQKAVGRNFERITTLSGLNGGAEPFWLPSVAMAKPAILI